MTKVPVHVTSEDIILGIRFSAAHCPIARALARAVRPVNGPLLVSSEDVIFPPHVVRALPPAALKFRDDFDTGKDVSPFHFIFEYEEKT